MGKNFEKKLNMKYKYYNHQIFKHLYDIQSEFYEYKGFTIQRLNKDQLWYVIHDNKIVNWSQYRNDLNSWIDSLHIDKGDLIEYA